MRTKSSSSTRSTLPVVLGSAAVAKVGAALSESSALIGSHSSTFVPRPSSLLSARAPPHWDIRPSTIESPSPVPLPMRLVEKNGSSARATVSLFHACARVGDRQTDIPSGCKLRLMAGKKRLGGHRDRQFAAVGHSVSSIYNEIEDRHLQLVKICLGQRQF